MADIAGLSDTAGLLDQEWTAERMHEAVRVHVFENVEEGESIGMYARNNTDVENGKGVVVDNIHNKEPATAESVPGLMWHPGLDILPHIILSSDYTHASGLTRNAAWTYSGGIALAGAGISAASCIVDPFFHAALAHTAPRTSARATPRAAPNPTWNSHARN